MPREDASGWTFRKILRLELVVVAMLLLLTGSSAALWDPLEALRKYSRSVEFDFSAWTVQALMEKGISAALKVDKFLPNEEQNALVDVYLQQVDFVNQLNISLDEAVSAPEMAHRDEKVAELQSKLTDEKQYLAELATIVEAVVQSQTERTLAEMGFGWGGQVFPPVLYKISDLPLNLIVSPRTEIRTVLSLNLLPGLDTLQKESIEEGIYTEFNYSALVEPIGGLSAYPTMVMQTTSFSWLVETVAHEWIHNYLFFHPLGLRYDVNPQMRTINETVASLAGTEIGNTMLMASFPDKLPPPAAPKMRSKLQEPGEEAGMVFDFRAEMRQTRVRVDELLAAGKVNEAEQYMEMRRHFFWEHGYHIRKINQAYFAFYGSYNDQPGGGAAGSDPVGPAVRKLWAESRTLKEFIEKVQTVRSYADLLEILEQPN
ncbi:MAG: hypothetical protein KA465_00725 [Anaerolineaceae bacterium]|nr:hypothetical protein [Anaerolineaceae bacterium]